MANFSGLLRIGTTARPSFVGRHIRAMSSDAGLTPSTVVASLDKHIIGQQQAKRALAVALRDRWRRRNVADEAMRTEIVPNNILLHGPTGSGKTECARRLAKTAQSPFVRTEATRFTEVGIVGTTVDTMIKELVEVAIHETTEKAKQEVAGQAQSAADELVLDLLLSANASSSERSQLRADLHAGKLDNRRVKVKLAPPSPAAAPLGMMGHDQFAMPAGMEDLMSRLSEELGPRKSSDNSPKKEMSVKEARNLLADEEAGKLLNMEQVKQAALEAAEQDGIVFVDEIDKIAASGSMNTTGGSWSKGEGVQKELLGLLEGTTVRTKHGPVKTNHMLFICAGAFHQSKPSDLLPELQGRLPIRVSLAPLTEGDFCKILSETENNLVAQQKALLEAEGVDLVFSEGAIAEIAKIAAQANSTLENIGARRLRTVMSKVMEEIKFEADKCRGTSIPIDVNYVNAQLEETLIKTDLQRYVL